MQPIINSRDICRILFSICHSAVLEQTSMPLREISPHAEVPVAEMLQGTPVDSALVAERLTTMFQCPEVARTLVPGATAAAWAQRVYDVWSRDPATITFVTSGSTGVPTAQPQSTALLLQESQEHCRVFTQGCRRVVSAVPAHHVYGFLFTILLPRTSGLPSLFPMPFPSQTFAGQLRSDDLVIAFPLFWEGLLKLGVAFPPAVRGVTSTAPCPPAVLKSLMDAGLATIFNIYGSSETGGLGYHTKPDEPLTLFAFWQRDKGLPVPCGSEQDVAMIARCLPGGGTDQPIQMPDNVAWLSDTMFRVLGRRDKLVQVGGINVSLANTAQCLRSHPMVKDCAVRLMRAEEGNRLKCFIVPQEACGECKALRTELASLCRTRLRPAERPKRYSFGDSLPVNNLGKHCDWD